MVKTFVWPWKDDGELLAVRQLLYPDPQLDADAQRDCQQLGVNIVNTWKLRRCRIPHSIQATADLVDAILHHDAEKNSVSTIKAVYAAALAKMVTSVCDLEQDSVEKRTMMEQARKIGMPEDWVHLRHNITHGKTPGLGTLQIAVRDAVPWMWNHFWKHLDPVEEIPDQEVSYKCRDILTAFRRQRRLEMTATQVPRAETVLAYQSSKMVHKLCKRNPRAIKIFVSLLLDDTLILLSPKQTNIKFKALRIVWEGLLLKVAAKEAGFYHIFAMDLAERCAKYIQPTPETTVVQNTMTEWLRHILKDSAWTGLLSPLALEDLRSDVLETCLLNPNKWTESVRKSVATVMNGDVAESLNHMAQVTCTEHGELSEDMERVEDASVGPKRSPKTRSGWSRPVDVWIPRPIGV